MPDNQYSTIIQKLEDFEKKVDNRFEKIEQNMATKADLAAVESRMATKADLAAVESRMATKADLARLETATKAEIARLEEKIMPKEEIERYFVAINETFSEHSKRFDEHDAKFDRIQRGVDRLLDLAESKHEEVRDINRRLAVVEAKVSHQKLSVAAMQG